MKSLTSVFANSAARLALGDSYSTSSKRELPDVRTVRLRSICRINSSFSGTFEFLGQLKIRRTPDAKPPHLVVDWSVCIFSLSITCSSSDSLWRSLTCVSTYDYGD